MGTLIYETGQWLDSVDKLRYLYEVWAHLPMIELNDNTGHLKVSLIHTVPDSSICTSITANLISHSILLECPLSVFTSFVMAKLSIIHDAVLTPYGRQQCVEFAQANPDFQNIPELIIASPFRRTLSTTLLAVPKTFERLSPRGVILMPQLQETHDFPCDTGSDRDVLEQIEEFKDRGFDWSVLPDDWNKNQGFYAPTPEALADRAKWVRRFVRDRPETNILLIGHGGIFREIDGRMRGPNSGVTVSLSVSFDSPVGL
ncbi:histidine phosphatase superfamily domain-containing protein [Rhizoctonia solani AG-1 IA]|uniref:Histidine phosphatase superfamily domain-containing protein n=1 Tax=Thanatephorus cucumeris (strain AG1-IA) TaxID=983506 RepID=L8WGH2_THACA|nr:histidine phosphatase superfamily domain-containing protein [Rhizoctonia solani AG-1 IA]